MNNRKRAKLKSAGRYAHYKSFGWLARVAYRLRGDKAIRKFVASGKYVREMGATPYQLIEGHDMWVMDVFISSTVRKSRVKNIRDGCQYITKDQLQYWREHGRFQENVDG